MSNSWSLLRGTLCAWPCHCTDELQIHGKVFVAVLVVVSLKWNSLRSDGPCPLVTSVSKFSQFNSSQSQWTCTIAPTLKLLKFYFAKLQWKGWSCSQLIWIRSWSKSPTGLHVNGPMLPLTRLSTVTSWPASTAQEQTRSCRAAVGTGLRKNK